MLRLLLPAIIPSWRFFDRIGPAPRVEVVLIAAPRDSGAAREPDAGGTACSWRAMWPLPASVGALTALGRLFWNPAGNESLFVVSCAERFLEDPTPAREALLTARVATWLRQAPLDSTFRWFRLRIVETFRENGRIVEHVRYVSGARPLHARPSDDAGTAGRR